MKKSILLVAAVLLHVVCLAQPTIHNLENFSIGTTLKFGKCVTQGVPFGDSGANLVWDYSQLSPLHDTVTEWMIAPSTTSGGSLFPGANLVEKYSDGKYIFVNKAANDNHLLGYIDSGANTTIQYPNDILFARRPMNYLTGFSDVYNDTFVASGYHFRGSGISVAKADAYGILKLPGGTYTNVLRVKIYQEQTDTLLEFGTVSVTKSYIYAWFDDLHTSALLKIDSINGSSFLQKDVQFLISETTPTGIVPPVKAQTIGIFPNPATGKIQVMLGSNGQGLGQLLILDVTGKMLAVRKLVDRNTEVDISWLQPGSYVLKCTTENGEKIERIIKR